MSKVKIAGNASGTGILTIEAPNTNTDRTLTLPDEAGTVLTSASTAVYPKGGPAFSAYVNGTQTISTGTYTKVTFEVESFDTNSNYDTSNYRFTPTVAGYYQVNWGFQLGTANFTGYIIASLYKNGSKIKDSVFSSVSTMNTEPTVKGSSLIYMNGSTDYLEVYAFHNAGANRTLYGANIWDEFSAVLVRAA